METFCGENKVNTLFYFLAGYLLGGGRIAALVVLAGFQGVAWSADIRNHPTIPHWIVIEGRIEKGDYDRFLEVALKAGQRRNDVILWSRGGDAVEAMRIGDLIRRWRYSTSAPRGNAPGEVPCHRWGAKDQANCVCESACFLIFSAGVKRSGNIVGMHRIYIDHNQLKGFTGLQAFETTRKLTNVVSSYLTHMGVPQRVIEDMEATPSHRMKYLEQEIVEKYFEGYIPEIGEWITAKCGDGDAIFEKIRELALKYKPLKGEQKKVYDGLSEKLNAIADCEVSANQRYIEEVWTPIADTERKSLKERTGLWPVTRWD